MRNLRLKSSLRFPLSFGLNLAVLFLCVAGVVILALSGTLQEGWTARNGLLVVLSVALSAAAVILIYQESRTQAKLRNLRAVLARVAEGSPMLLAEMVQVDGLEGLETEIRLLAARWGEFCAHCQGEHDSEMTRAEHLATIGELAAGVAHEIRNPLAGIAGAIEIVTHDIPKDHPDRAILEDLNHEVLRIQKTLNELLAYARPKPPQFAATEIEEIVARTVHLARQQAGQRRIEFSVRVSPEVPHFLADSAQLHQVLLNLVLNGIQAIDREGKITIEVTLGENGGPGRDSRVEIAVSDTGKGVPAEDLHRIFRPFYTTKQGGTGLGLSLCSRIIDAHGGTLKAESERNVGTRFVIRLPLRSAATELTHIQV